MFAKFDYDDYPQEQAYFGNSKIMKNSATDTYQLNAMRAGGWMPTNGMPKEDPTLPFNLTLNKASVGLPTVNKALYNQFPQQPWDIDPSALCNVENSQNYQKQMEMVKDRAARSGWDVLAGPADRLPGDVQARRDGVTQVNQGRLQDRRLITQNVSRTTPVSGFGSGSSAVPLGYENLNFPTTEAPVGLDNCESNEGYNFMNSDMLGFNQQTNQLPKWNQEDMGSSADDTASIFPYQGNNRFLMSQKDPVSGKTYMVFGRDPLLENTGKVYDEVPSRQLGRTNRRLEDMTGNRRLTSPMPNKTEVPNQLVIPDKPGLARAEYEAERRDLERRVAKQNFFVRDNGLRPPPPEAARTSSGTPYTGFVGIREMARYNNVNEPSMKEPEFAARKYERTVLPQTHVTVRAENVPEIRPTFFVAGISGSSSANTADPVGMSNVTTKPAYSQLPASNLEANDEYLNENVHLQSSAIVRNQQATMMQNREQYEDTGFVMDRMQLGNASVSSMPANSLNARPGEDTSFVNQESFLRSGVNVVSFGGNAALGNRDVESNFEMNENNRLVSGYGFNGSESALQSRQMQDDKDSVNYFAKLSAPINAQHQPYQLTTMDDFIPKDDLNSVTRLATRMGTAPMTQLDTDFQLATPDFMQSGMSLQTNINTKPATLTQNYSDPAADKDFMQQGMSVNSNYTAPSASTFAMPVRGFENINSDVQMSIDHSFMPTFGHGGMNTANQVPKLTDNGQVDNDRVIPWDWLSGSRRVEQELEYMKGNDSLPANFRAEYEMAKEPYLSDLRTYQEVEAAKYKNNEQGVVSIRKAVSDSQKDAFDLYKKRRALRKSVPRNADSDTDTDCDVSKI